MLLGWGTPLNKAFTAEGAENAEKSGLRDHLQSAYNHLSDVLRES